MCCFKNQNFNSDLDRMKKIFDNTYKTCILKHEIQHVSHFGRDLYEKLCDCLRRGTYDEKLFNLIKKKIKLIFKNDYLPLYFKSLKKSTKWSKASSKSTSIMTKLNNPEPIKEPLNIVEHSRLETTVAYYLPGESLAYISTFSGKNLTLAQFKHLITKRGAFRYFFKTKTDLLEDECVVFQEVTDDKALLPTFNDKVIAKIEYC